MLSVPFMCLGLRLVLRQRRCLQRRCLVLVLMLGFVLGLLPCHCTDACCRSSVAVSLSGYFSVPSHAADVESVTRASAAATAASFRGSARLCSTRILSLYLSYPQIVRYISYSSAVLMFIDTLTVNMCL